MFDYLDYKNKIPLDLCTRGKIPKLNPYSQKYKEYWKGVKRDIIEGYWVEYNNEFKWIPPVLALYNNLWTIEMSMKGSKSQNKTKGTPRLRDIEWIKGYIWAWARGFSGFEKDDTYSCNKILISENRDEYISYAPDHIVKSIYNSKGELKEYIEPLPYLYKYFDKNLGKPQFYNPALNVPDIECRNIGKAQPIDSIVQTLDGTKKLKDLKINDKIFDDSGELTNVIGIHKKGFKDIYKVTFKDGRTTECCGEHLWTVYHRQKWITVDINRILSTSYKINRKNGYEEYYYRIPLTKPLKYNYKDLLIDPYILGCWLGDGNSSSLSLYNIDSEIIERFKDFGIKNNFKLRLDDKIGFHLSKTKGISESPIKLLRQLNLYKNKHIPEEYFYSDINQRLELLRGLLDTDGTICKNGYIQFDNINLQLVKNVERLCQSLGIKTTFKEKKTSWTYKGIKKYSISYRVFLDTDLEVFYLSRKKDRLFKNKSNKRKIQSSTVAITNIEYIGKKDSICISVGNKSHLYLTNDFIVTHNSMIGGAMVGHNFLTDGSMDYDELLELRKEGLSPMSETLVSAVDSKYSTGLINKLKLGLDSLPGTVTVGKEVFPSPISKKYTGSFISGKHIESTYEKKVGNNWTRVGSKSRILHRSFGDNPFAANGTRPGFTIIDEVGFMGNLLEALGQLAECTTTDGRKFGTIWMTGTGGDMASGATEAVKKVFYDPSAYDCIQLDDIFENKGKIGLFIPAWMALDEFRDELGNVNKELAIKKLMRERAIAMNAKSKAPLYALLQMKPLVPSEAFLVLEGNIFPVGELKEHLATLESTDKKQNLGTVGWMYRNEEGKSYFKPDQDLVPADYPTKESDNPHSAVVIWEQPIDNIPYGQYVAGIDPYDQDKANSSVSYGSIFIFKRMSYDGGTYNLPVAEYTGRPEFAADFYEQCRRLLEYYNCKALYENQNTGLKTYLQTKNSLHLLHVQPDIIKSISPNSKVQRGYGIHMSTPIKDELEIMTRDWLKQEIAPGILQLTKICSIPLLKELIAYSKDGNFDRVIAFMLCIMQNLEMHNILISETVKEVEVDEFFNRKLFTKR